MRNFSEVICRENQNTRFMLNNFFFRKLYLLWDNVAKYCRAGPATKDNMAHAHCMLGTYGNKHTIRYVTLIALPLQKWLHEGPWLLRYTHIACLVNFGTKWTWLVTSTPRPICWLELLVLFQFNRNLGENRSKSGSFWEERRKSILPFSARRRNSRIFQTMARAHYPSYLGSQWIPVAVSKKSIQGHTPKQRNPLFAAATTSDHKFPLIH
jgi:hypothetical protein